MGFSENKEKGKRTDDFKLLWPRLNEKLCEVPGVASDTCQMPINVNFPPSLPFPYLSFLKAYFKLDAGKQKTFESRFCVPF